MPLNPFPDSQTYKIIGAGMAVHSELGCGFLEKVYRLALPFEFDRMQVPFTKEKNLTICYKGHMLPVDYRRFHLLRENRRRSKGGFSTT